LYNIQGQQSHTLQQEMERDAVQLKPILGQLCQGQIFMSSLMLM